MGDAGEHFGTQQIADRAEFDSAFTISNLGLPVSPLPWRGRLEGGKGDMGTEPHAAGRSVWIWT